MKFAVKSGLKLLSKQFSPLAFLFTGPIGFVVGYFAEKFLYFLVDQAILIIDIKLMERRVELQEKDYRKAIYDAYIGAKGKVLSEEEKQKLRQAVLDATHKFVRIGKLSKRSNS